MQNHEEIQDLIPAYVLGALEPDETTHVQAHLAACNGCARILAEYRTVADRLVYAAPSAAPPLDLKARTMRRALGRDHNVRPITHSSERPWFQRLGLAPVLAASALVLSIILLGWILWRDAQFNDQLAEQREFMTVIAYAQGAVQTAHGTEASPQAIGKLYSDPDSNVAALVTVNMPRLGEDQVYEVWLTRADGKTLSGGTFSIDAEGNGWLLIRSSERFDSYIHVDVSTESRGGSSVRTGQVVLETALTSP